MDNYRPKTPPPTIGCRCTGRCKCCDAPERPPRYAHNPNKRVNKLFGSEEKPGKFPYIECAQAPTLFE